MNIAGVLVHSHPDFTETVARSLSALPGVEVHVAAEE